MDKAKEVSTERNDRMHAAVLMDYQGEMVEIDRKIAPLMQAVWDVGIETLMSCEDVSGMLWIEFDSPEDAMRFLDIAVVYDETDNSIYNRAESLSQGGSRSRDWEYLITPVNMNGGDQNLTVGDPVEFYATVG